MTLKQAHIESFREVKAIIWPTSESGSQQLCMLIRYKASSAMKVRVSEGGGSIFQCTIPNERSAVHVDPLVRGSTSILSA